MKNLFVHFGTIKGAVGIKGELKIKVFLQNKNLVNSFKKVYDKDNKKNWEIKFVRFYKDGVVVNLDKIQDRNDAQKLIGTKLFVEKKYLPPLQKEEYYAKDLVGFIVKKQDGESLGSVEEINNFGAGDLISIKKKNNKTFLIPFNKENIKKIDFKNKIITVNPLKGIL
ncbi:MAG: Ribosome maturation factor RimM [Alphaproteobacteria bacterium MarineAlpha5_Bin11]|nr:16S rRNA processing protein RimM [Pelagibacteraceae bacterium]PPR44002.1 MAG: Ribosome maturation factor RimM [Alphaproteobacteria bacterium MarineAlpha5_Bin11]PPR51223.1 MAG: Ribosome maturation factor RimM [Alphaproteobacteria bacterium MarineAlpha5_Bin10]